MFHANCQSFLDFTMNVSDFVSRNRKGFDFAFPEIGTLKQLLAVVFYRSNCLIDEMSLVMRKPDFCTCENKDADQLRGNLEAEQRLCFRYIDSTIPLLPKYGISSL